MKGFEVRVRRECVSCKGTGRQANPDYDVSDKFTEQQFETCLDCKGKKKVEVWMSADEFMRGLFRG